jgi:hypothetical protein
VNNLDIKLFKKFVPVERLLAFCKQYLLVADKESISLVDDDILKLMPAILPFLITGKSKKYYLYVIII